MRPELGYVAVTGKRRPARERFIENASERIHIDAPVDAGSHAARKAMSSAKTRITSIKERAIPRPCLHSTDASSSTSAAITAQPSAQIDAAVALSMAVTRAVPVPQHGPGY